MRSALNAAVIVALLVAPVYAEPAEVLPRAKTPEEVGLSSERLARVGAEKSDGAGGKTLEVVDAPREITVQDLLRHTSGFTYGSRGDSLVHRAYREAHVGSRDDTNADLVAKLGRLPLLYAPGTRWEYGVSTDVLGRLVEVVSGMTLGRFFEERIFRPLGLTDTAFWVPADKTSRAAQPWQRSA